MRVCVSLPSACSRSRLPAPARRDEPGGSGGAGGAASGAPGTSGTGGISQPNGGRDERRRQCMTNGGATTGGVAMGGASTGGEPASGSSESAGTASGGASAGAGGENGAGRRGEWRSRRSERRNRRRRGLRQEPRLQAGPTAEHRRPRAETNVDRINQFLTQCACLPALKRRKDGESLRQRDGGNTTPITTWLTPASEQICEPGGSPIPALATPLNKQVISLCMQQMWDEGPPPPQTAPANATKCTATSSTWPTTPSPKSPAASTTSSSRSGPSKTSR